MSYAYSGYSNEAVFTVGYPRLASLSVVPNTATIQAGNTQLFTAQGVDVMGNSVVGSYTGPGKVTWSVLNVNGYGTIDKISGLFRGQTAGLNIQVVATANDGSGLTAIANVVVVAGSIARIVVTPGAVQLEQGQGQQFSALGFDNWNNAVALTNPPPTWTVSGAIGSIGGTGLFLSSANGVGIVAASQNNVTGTAQVVVMEVVGGVPAPTVQQPFARIQIRDTLNAPIIIDTRRRGGGLRNRADLPSQDDFWWDLTNYDGLPFQMFGVYVAMVNGGIIDPTQLISYDLGKARVSEVLSKYAAPQFLGVLHPSTALPDNRIQSAFGAR